jgi:cell division protein FtsW
MLRPSQGLILITLALLCTGVVMVNSAGLTIGAEVPLDLRTLLFGRAAMVAMLAMAMATLGTMVPLGRIERLHGAANPIPWLVLVMIVLLLLVHVPGIGREVNGARRWITLGTLGFQPSEIAKWSLPFVLAWYVTRRPEAMSRFTTGFALPMGLVAVVCALIATEDLGTAVLIACVSVCILLAAGARIWHAAMLLPAGALGIAAALVHSPYRIERVRTFLDPYADPQGAGYHMIQSMAAVSGGSLAGRGLGNSVQKFGYLPEDTTDFLFAIICEELGIVGAGLIVCLYAALALCGLSIIRRCDRPFLQLVGLGIMLNVILQAMMNIAVVTGCVPTKGIALPLVSWGGTGWVLTAFGLGLLAGMDGNGAARPAAGEHRSAGTPALLPVPE